MDREQTSTGLLIYRWVVAVLLIALGIFGCARIALELQRANAPPLDWLALTLTAVPLAFGVMIAAGARKNPPPRFIRKRKGAARIFGSAWIGAMLVTSLLIRLFKQTSLFQATAMLAGAVLFWGLLAIIYGAINGDIEEREKRSAGRVDG